MQHGKITIQEAQTVIQYAESYNVIFTLADDERFYHLLDVLKKFLRFERYLLFYWNVFTTVYELIAAVTVSRDSNRINHWHFPPFLYPLPFSWMGTKVWHAASIKRPGND